MCACIGGLDRAHIHIMSVPKETDKKTDIAILSTLGFTIEKQV